jgi:hypothetical protein
MLRRVVQKQLSMIADGKEDESVSQKEVDQFIHHHHAAATPGISRF